MRLMPKQQSEKIAWCQAHVTSWAEHAETIGTSAAAVAALEEMVAEAEAARLEAGEARDRARAATLALKDKLAAMEAAAADIVRQVRAEAEATDNRELYVLASLPAPATPSPVGAPGTPYAMAAELRQDGAVDLKWKCRHPHGCTGVMYHVWRRPRPGSGGGEYVFLGSTGKKRFRDATIPEGTAGVTYMIQAVRSTGSGEGTSFNVNFGVAPGSPTSILAARRGGGGVQATLAA